jgi:hypothetical protein
MNHQLQTLCCCCFHAYVWEPVNFLTVCAWWTSWNADTRANCSVIARPAQTRGKKIKSMKVMKKQYLMIQTQTDTWYSICYNTCTAFLLRDFFIMLQYALNYCLNCILGLICIGRNCNNKYCSLIKTIMIDWLIIYGFIGPLSREGSLSCQTIHVSIISYIRNLRFCDLYGIIFNAW